MTKTTTTKNVTVTGALNCYDLQLLVRREIQADVPYQDVKIELVVRVPGGGDYSGAELEISDDALQVEFRATWSETVVDE